MGTSITHRSRATVSWRAVAAGYEYEHVPEARVLRDVWRAALGEPEAAWLHRLTSGSVERLSTIAVESHGPSEGLRSASRAIVEAKDASVAADIAKRAVVASFAYDDRRMGFATSLFAGVTDYLVSRDLAGHIGLGTRNTTVPEAIEFKRRLRDRTTALVAETAPGRGTWADMVHAVLDQLKTT